MEKITRNRIGLGKVREKIRHYACLLMLLCMLPGCGQEEEGVLLLQDAQGTGQEGSPAGLPAEGEEPEDAAPIYVQVSGAVASPGVYTLPQGARMFQAIELAGGLTEEADAKSLNQAGLLADGQMVYVMSQEEAAAQASLAPAREGPEYGANDGRVNLNTATEPELMALPGIGAAKAKSILAWREENGGFSQIEDLMKVQGIKEGVFSKIKDSIKVE